MTVVLAGTLIVLAGTLFAVTSRRRLQLATGTMMVAVALPLCRQTLPTDTSWVYAAGFELVAGLLVAWLIWSTPAPRPTSRRGMAAGWILPRWMWVMAVLAAAAGGLAVWPRLVGALDPNLAGTAADAPLDEAARLCLAAASAALVSAAPLLAGRDPRRLAAGAALVIVAADLLATSVGAAPEDVVLAATGILSVAAAAAMHGLARTPGIAAGIEGPVSA